MSAQDCADTIGRVFSSLQESGKRASVEGAKREVVSLLSSFSASEVLDGFLPPLRHILCHKSNSRLLQAYLELVTSLIVEFSHLSRSGAEFCLLDEVLEEVLRLSGAKNRVVRNRTCELLCHIVALRGATQFSLSGWEERIHGCLLTRARDKISSVRCESLIGLSKFMDPADTLCPCVARILWHVIHDASSEVRKKCLQLLPLSNETLDTIVSRVADSSVEVRVTAFKILTDNIHLKYLKPSEVMSVLKIAILEDNEGVKVAFQNLLKKWLAALEGDTIFILQRMDLIGETEICSQTIQKLFNLSDLGAIQQLWHDLTGVDTTSLPDGLLGSATFEPPAISVEFSFLWTNLAKFLHRNQTSPQLRLECVVPDPVEFSEFLGKFQEHFLSQNGAYSVQLRFTFENILTLLELIDYSNESGRERVIVALKTLITNREFHLSLIEPSLRHFTLICPEVNNRIMNLSTAIIAMNVSPPSPARTGDTSVHTSDNDTPALPLDTRESDTLDKNLRSLRITISLMQQVKIQQPDSHLLSLVRCVLIPNLLSQDSALRELALRGLALAAMTGLEMAHNVVPGFIMVATEALFLDHLSVQVAALCAILDLFLLYGDSVLKMMSMLVSPPDSEDQGPGPDASEVKQHLVSLLLRVLQSDCPELQETALVGLCKLFLANRIGSCNLLGQLLIRSFHPVANTSAGLTEAIFAFFYSFTSRCEDNCVLLADSLAPTLWTVFEAPEDTFLSLVSLDAVCDKVLFFLSQRKCHNLLVEPLLTLCLSNPEMDKVCKSALRCLSQSDLRDFKHELPVLQHWGRLANQIARDLVANSFIRKFQEKLKDLNPEFEMVSPCHFVTPKCAPSVTKSTAKKGYGRSNKKVNRVQEQLTPRIRSQRLTKPINYVLDFNSDEDS